MDEIFANIVQDRIDVMMQELPGEPNPFEELVSMGELIDRLTIVNVKLYDLKNKVMAGTDSEFRAWASIEDVRLVEERARLKKCINVKLDMEIQRMIATGESSANPETKRYA